MAGARRRSRRLSALVRNVSLLSVVSAITAIVTRPTAASGRRSTVMSPRARRGALWSCGAVDRQWLVGARVLDELLAHASTSARSRVADRITRSGVASARSSSAVIAPSADDQHAVRHPEHFRKL